MILSEQAERAKRSLLELQACLDSLEKRAVNGINVFQASGMVRQEIKHSAFLAWLLDPKMPHGLGGKVLRMFCEELLVYQVPRDDFPELTDKSIIGGIANKLCEMSSDPNIVVETEKVLLDRESRMDIFIDSPATETLMVIENKIFTDAHDNQVYRYKQETDRHEIYKNYDKVFVYLSPFGSPPQDKYWCVFDYGSVLKIVERVLTDLPRKKENVKLKILLEDYMELVDTEILKGNKELRALCKGIIRKYGDALRLLNEYTDNALDVIDYCKQWLTDNCNGVHIFRDGKMSFDIFTDSTKKYFEAHDGGLFLNSGECKCRATVRADNAVVASLCIAKSRDIAWSEAQKAVMDTFMPDKKRGELYFGFAAVTLITEQDRELSFEEVRPHLDKNLECFADKIRQLDKVVCELMC